MADQSEPVLIDPLVMEIANWIKEAKAMKDMAAYVEAASYIVERVKNGSN